jgi:hypothetical protein
MLILNLEGINLLSQPRGVNQAAYAHTVKAPAFSLGGVLNLLFHLSRTSLEDKHRERAETEKLIIGDKNKVHDIYE